MPVRGNRIKSYICNYLESTQPKPFHSNLQWSLCYRSYISYSCIHGNRNVQITRPLESIFLSFDIEQINLIEITRWINNLMLSLQRRYMYQLKSFDSMLTVWLLLCSKPSRFLSRYQYLYLCCVCSVFENRFCSILFPVLFGGRGKYMTSSYMITAVFF